MVNYWFKEFRRLLAVILLAIIFGLYFGRFWVAFSLCLTAYVCWTFWQLWRIRSWLANPESSQVPQSLGLWGEINDSIYSLYKAQLREKERLSQTIKYLHDSFASLPDAVVMVDSQGGIDWCNDSSASLLGLHYPRDRNQALVNFLRGPEFLDYFENGDYQRPLETISTLDGITWLQFVITRFGQGNRLVFARDISAIKKSQQMRRDFLANISHELRTPLTVIGGYLDNLSLVPQIKENRAMNEAIAQMHLQSERMESLIKDITDLSRIESKPEADLEKEVHLAGLLQEIRANALAAASGKCEITLECPENYYLFGSTKNLHSIFSNLVTNAVKYSGEEGRVDILVSSHNNRLQVAVKDNGVGIESHHIPRLTERFYRVDSSRNSETGGTGLGLAIVKHALSRHGAELFIESELGLGSEFLCVFPENRFKKA